MYMCIGLVCLIDDEDDDCGGGGGDECDGVLGVKKGIPSLALLQKRLNGLHALLNLHSFDLDDYLKFPIEFLK